MDEPTPRINGIRQQFCRVTDDLTLVSVVVVSLAYAELWVVTRGGAAERIGRTPDGAIGKVDSAGATFFNDGTARLWASAADVGGGGATSHTVWADFPDVVPPNATADAAARWQANAATNMAALALNQNKAQDVRLDALEGAA